MVRIVRYLKGLAMFIMFCLFALGIILEIILVLPVISLWNHFYGFRPGRLQGVNRVLFTIWLGLLGFFQLLKARPPEGRPIEGPCVVVANHPGLFDVLYLIRDIPNLSVLVNYQLTRRLPLGPIFRSSGYVLSPDFDTISPLESLEEAMNWIRTGMKFMLFPEGTRSPVGGLHPFKAGAFKVASRMNLPVQPVLVRNFPPFLPKKAKWYYPPFEVSIIKLEFWPPVPPPAPGQERDFARQLEARYAQALGMITHGNL